MNSTSFSHPIEVISAEDDIVDILSSILIEKGRMHYLALIKHAVEDGNDSVKEFFSHFDSSEKFWFFGNRPESFDIEDNGYVEVIHNVRGYEERVKRMQVVGYFISVLKTAQKMHYSKLVIKLQTSDADVKHYFDSLPEDDHSWFFENRPSVFDVWDGYVSLQKEVQLNMFHVNTTSETLQKPQSTTTSASKTHEIECAQINDGSDNEYYSVCSEAGSVTVSACAGTGSTDDTISAEDNVVRSLCSTLVINGSMHYLAVIRTVEETGNSCVGKYFSSFNESDKFWFFRDRPESFVITNSGWVTASDSVFKRFKEEQEKVKENEVIDYFVSVLKDTPKIHFLKLVECLKNSYTDVDNYFDSWSASDIYWFFRNRSSIFEMGRDSYVLLQKKSESLTGEGTSYTSLKDNERQCTQSNEINVKKYANLDDFDHGTLCSEHHSRQGNLCSEHHSKQGSVCSEHHLRASSHSIDSKVSLKEQDVEIPASTMLDCESPHYSDRSTLSNEKEHSSSFQHVDITVDEHADERKVRSDSEKKKCKISIDSPDLESSGVKSDVAIETQSSSGFEGISREVTEKSVVDREDNNVKGNITIPTSSVELTSIGETTSGISAGVHTELNKSTEEDRTIPKTEERRNERNGYISFSNDECHMKAKKDSESQYSVEQQQNRSNCCTLPDISVEEAVLQSLAEILTKTGEVLYPLLTSLMSKNENCDVENYFHRFDSGERLFETRPKTFSGEDSGIMSLTSTVLESFLKENKEKMDKVIKYFISTLEAAGRLHYQDLIKRLQTSESEVNNYFDSYSKSYSYFFFKNRPSIFVVESDSYVCLSGKDMEQENERCNSIQDPELDSHLPKGFGPNKGRRGNPGCGLGSVDNKSVQNGKKTEPVMDLISVKTPDKLHTCDRSDSFLEINCNSESNVADISIDKNSGSLISSQVKENTSALSMTEVHVQSLRYFVILLKDRKNAHYHKLLYKVCSYDRHTSNFFSYFSLADVLEFIRMHSMYFFVQDDGSVSLVDPTVTPSDVLASEHHFRQVADSIDSKAVEFFVNLLKKRKRLSLTELESYLGSSPGYVISLFVANYCGDNFSKFFQQRANYFHIRADQYVELS